MTVSIEINDVSAQIPELLQQVKAGEEVAIWENGILVARLLPGAMNSIVQEMPYRNAAEAFAGRVGQISTLEAPADLAANDEFYFAELMQEKQQRRDPAE